MSTLPEAVRNGWHMVGLSRQWRVGQVRAITLCDMPLAVFRTDAGLGALVDRCPHRNYPLSKGRVHLAALECPYHGWRFGADGRCQEVPGCATDRLGAPGLNADAVRVIERHGGVFVTLSSDAPDEPDMPPDFSNPDLDHFWWQQGVWEGRAFDAIENVMDPFHTNHLHHGYIRRRDRRLPVRLEVASQPRSIAMTIVQTEPDLGLMSRFLERDRAHSVSTYYPPTIVQARWQGEQRLTLCVTAIFTPSTASSFMPFARFSTPRGLAPAWAKQAAIRLFLQHVVAQDREALAAQHGVMTRFGHPRFVSGPGDILGSRLHLLWQGEILPSAIDLPVVVSL